MKEALRVGLFFLLAVALFGQHRNYGSSTGFGNVVFPGMGNPPPLTPNPYFRPSPNATFPERLGAVVAGSPIGINGGRGRRNVMVPYAYPVFVGGYGYGYGYGFDPQMQAAQPAPTTVVYAYPPQQQQQQQQQQQPQVIINQNFLGTAPQTSTEPDSGTTSFYQAPSRVPVEAATTNAIKTPVFLIAYKDHSVYTAVAYWVDGDTLHYITTEGKHNQASLALIDRDMSDELNKEREVEFKLPK